MIRPLDRHPEIPLGEHDVRIVYRNAAGHGLLRQLDAMNMTLKMLIAKDERKSREIKEHEKQIISLKGQVGRLMQSSESYLSIRDNQTQTQ